MMNPFQAMQAFGNPQSFIQQQLRNRMEQMAKKDPQAFQKMQEMTNGKNEDDLKKTCMNLAEQRGVDIKQFASQFGIKL